MKYPHEALVFDFAPQSEGGSVAFTVEADGVPYRRFNMTWLPCRNIETNSYNGGLWTEALIPLTPAAVDLLAFDEEQP